MLPYSIDKTYEVISDPGCHRDAFGNLVQTSVRRPPRVKFMAPDRFTYFNHYDYFKQLIADHYGGRRAGAERSLIKIAAPRDVMSQLRLADFSEMLKRKISASFQISHGTGEDNELIQISYPECTFDGTLETVYELDEYYRMEEGHHIEDRANGFWSTLKRSNHKFPLISACAFDFRLDEAYRNETLGEFVDLSQCSDLLKAFSNEMETRGNNFVATTSGCISGPAKEDPNLTSVNVMLFGRPKVWYVVPDIHFSTYVALTDYLLQKNECPLDAGGAPSALYILPPDTLYRGGIPFHTVVQNPGDIVYVNPRCVAYSISTGPTLDVVGFGGSVDWARQVLNNDPTSAGLYDEAKKVALREHMRRNGIEVDVPRFAASGDDENWLFGDDDTPSSTAADEENDSCHEEGSQPLNTAIAGTASTAPKID